MNYKRKKTKRQVRCSMCTKHKWLGNSNKDYFGPNGATIKRRDKSWKEETK